MARLARRRRCGRRAEHAERRRRIRGRALHRAGLARRVATRIDLCSDKTGHCDENRSNHNDGFSLLTTGLFLFPVEPDSTTMFARRVRAINTAGAGLRLHMGDLDTVGIDPFIRDIDSILQRPTRQARISGFRLKSLKAVSTLFRAERIQ